MLEFHCTSIIKKISFCGCLLPSTHLLCALGKEDDLCVQKVAGTSYSVWYLLDPDQFNS